MKNKLLPKINEELQDAILRKNITTLLQTIDDLGAISNTV
jgi:hypothetical protein